MYINTPQANHTQHEPIWTFADCPPLYPHEPFIYPTRLRIAGNAHQIYAYPAERPEETLVQLQTEVPALVTYVFEPTWTTELNGTGYIRVPESNWTNDDELDLTLKILRAGGAFMDNTYALNHWWMLDDGFGSGWRDAERQKKYIFGWPDEGGVWVLHLPPPNEKYMDGEDTLGEEIEQMVDWENLEPTIFRDFDGSVHYGNLTEMDTMDKFCKRLEGAGAVYYAEVEKSPEVVELGLLSAEDALGKGPIKV